MVILYTHGLNRCMHYCSVFSLSSFYEAFKHNIQSSIVPSACISIEIQLLSIVYFITHLHFYQAFQFHSSIFPPWSFLLHIISFFISSIRLLLYSVYQFLCIKLLTIFHLKKMIFTKIMTEYPIVTFKFWLFLI